MSERISGMLNGNGKLSSVTTTNVCRRDGDVLLSTKAPCKRSNIVGQQLPTLLDVTDVASVCTPCCMLLDVVACCCAKFETGQTFQPTTSNISFVPWSPKRSAIMLDPFAQLFQHCWGRRTLITHGLQRLMRCILPTMHCRSQHCWELLYPFAHHCQYERNNSQHYWRKNVGSCCVRLHAA